MHFPLRELRLRTLLLGIAGLAILFEGTSTPYQDWRKREQHRRECRLLHAADQGDLDTMNQLLDAGIDVNVVTNGRYPWTALMHAAFEDRYDAASLLLDRGADPNHEDLDGETAITVAASAGHWRLVRLLLDRGANPSPPHWAGPSLAEMAQEQGRIDIARAVSSPESPPDPPPGIAGRASP